MSITNLFTNTVAKFRTTVEEVVIDRFPDVSDAPPDSRRLIRDRRYCVVLSSYSDVPFDDLSLECGWRALEFEMAMIPGGEVGLESSSVLAEGETNEIDEIVAVDSFYLDRDCVTNEDFARFVTAGGYVDPNNWPEEILPHVLRFTDQTGHPGPRYWSGGKPPRGKLHHPVVGISWYEANAFAAFAGKRLPSTEQWQRAGTWATSQTGDREPRYPWGNAFSPTNANVWASRIGEIVPVSEFEGGNTPNGVRQLIGNVWEWVDTQFAPGGGAELVVDTDQSMAEIRGGAFDTYFHSQATCQFRSGQPLLFRGANVGFRCCIGEDDLNSNPKLH